MSALIVGSLLAIVVALVGMMDRLRRQRKPHGIHSGEAAARWASARFPSHLQSLAAYVADLICEHGGVSLSQIEPMTDIVGDLRMDDLEPVELLMALEEELGIVIPEEDCEPLSKVGNLVEYLHRRLSAKGPGASKSAS